MSSLTDLLQTNGDFAQNPEYQRLGGFVQGTVVENDKKDFAGMVKVQFTAWTSGKNICEWIPLLVSYAGKEYGSYRVPEVGDIVLVGFIGSGLHRPFVLGSLYPPDASFLGESFVAENTTRRFKTKGGIDLTLSDEDSKQSITAATPKGLTLSMSDEKQIVSLSDKNKKNMLSIDCQKGEISLTANAKITIKAGACEISMDGNAGKMTIKCNQLEVKAMQKADIISDLNMTVSGAILKVEGKTTAQLKGGAMTEISGGMVKIN